MKLLSDTEIEGGYTVVAKPDPRGVSWKYYFFILNYDNNREFLIDYYKSNNFASRRGFMFFKRDMWNEFDDWYFNNFDAIYEFTFVNAEDAMAFKLRWM